jgi:CxxC-x17-CxxC domain-containing protein
MENISVNYTDIPLLLIKIQQRLTSLENKIDILVSRGLPANHPEQKPIPLAVQSPAQVNPPAVTQKQVPANPGNAVRPGNNNRSRRRMLYKVVCAECKKECEIPFKPNGDRPVYCRECFARRKAGNSLKAGAESKSQEVPLAAISSIDEKQAVEKEELVENKEPVVNKAPVKKKNVVVRKKSVAVKKAFHKIKALKASKKKKAR